jgi:hypothetical protein
MWADIITIVVTTQTVQTKHAKSNMTDNILSRVCDTAKSDLGDNACDALVD